MSQIGMQSKSEYGVDGYYFCDPASTSGAVAHCMLYIFFYPAIKIEKMTTRRPEPLWSMPLFDLS